MQYFHILCQIYMKHTKIIFINETPLQSQKLAFDKAHFDFSIDDVASEYNLLLKYN